MEELFEKLSITPKNTNLYKTAFSHSSYANEHYAKTDYERLEFLGDAVVDLVIADYLYNNKHDKEGEMTKVRASYVCENALCEYSTNLGLNKYIRVGHGEEKEGGKYKKAIVADIFEAFIGAIYVDLGYATARKVVLNIIVPYIENPNITFFSDYHIISSFRNLSYLVNGQTGPSTERTLLTQGQVSPSLIRIAKGQLVQQASFPGSQSAVVSNSNITFFLVSIVVFILSPPQTYRIH